MKNIAAHASVDGILQEVHDYLNNERSLKVAREFGLDAPERMQLITQVLLIKEQRDTNDLLIGLMEGIEIAATKFIEGLQEQHG